MISRLPLALGLIAMLALLAGCAGYRVGSAAAFPAGQHSIQIGLIRNQTLNLA